MHKKDKKLPYKAYIAYIKSIRIVTEKGANKLYIIRKSSSILNKDQYPIWFSDDSKYANTLTMELPAGLLE